jgi:hypothetical protein
MRFHESLGVLQIHTRQNNVYAVDYYALQILFAGERLFKDEKSRFTCRKSMLRPAVAGTVIKFPYGQMGLWQRKNPGETHPGVRF